MDKNESLLYGLDGEPADESKINTLRTSLEFEVLEDVAQPTLDEVSPTVYPEAEPAVSEPILAANEPSPQPTEEFSMPDVFDVCNDKGGGGIETPANMRTTYLPKFTEISDTYRMQDDPRPRQDVLKQTPTVENSADEISDNDPISESVEEKEIDKVVLTTGNIKKTDITDESITILKFSTPIESETQNAMNMPEPKEEAAPADEPADAVEAEEAEQEEAQEPKPRNMTIPDPDKKYNVVDFRANEANPAEEAPEGSMRPSDVAIKHSGYEFTSPIQRDSIKDRFLDSLMSIKVRLVTVLCGLIALAVIDVAALFGVDFVSGIGFNGIPSARAVVDLLFCLFMYLLAVPETVKSFKRLINKKCTPEIFATASLLAVLANDLILALSDGVNEYATFGVLFGLQIFAIVLSSYFKTRSDFESFKLTSKNVSKNVLDKKLTRSLPRENLALDGIIDEYNSKTSRMFHTAFVSDFFARSSSCVENYANMLTILGITTGISLFTGLVSFFLNEFSLIMAVQSFAMVFLVSLPAFSILAHKLPYKHSSNEAKEEDGAFIGEASLYDCAGVDVITYDDVEIFGTEDVSIIKYHFYGKAYNSSKAMKQMYSIFSVVGGPLDYVFSSSLDRKYPSATDIMIEDDGISGTVDGHRVYAGTEAYMQRHGISIPSDDYRTNTSSSDSTKIMYGAEDNEVYAKFFIRYSFSEEFTMLLPDLRARKIVPLIYTRDPNITNELLRVLTFGEDAIRVMRKYVPAITENKVYRHISSGVVSHGDKMNLVNMILIAKRYTALQSSLAVAELAAMAIGAAVSVVMSVIGIFSLPSAVLALWQIAWMTVLFIKSKLVFGVKKPKDEEESYEE